MIKKIVYYSIAFFSIILILATLLSLIYDVNYWYIKVLDFPRLQILIAASICLLLLLMLRGMSTKPQIILIIALGIAMGIQAYFILPYTIIVDKNVESVTEAEFDEETSFSLLIANVFMENKNTSDFLKTIARQRPDIILAMETNKWWLNQIEVLEKTYPYSMKYPLDNTYGMALYSKLPLLKSNIRFLNHKTVPSFHTQIQLPNNSVFNFHGVHPVPPKPSEYPDNIGEEEVELIKTGKMVASETKPSVVAGDFNDVAWSNTARIFEKGGKLYNVNIGRGLYLSFDAKSWIWRWPLDFVYVTKEFKASNLEMLPHIGSDHYPIFVKLQLFPQE